MPGGIDHLVLCVRDLDRAREFYGRLGFALTPPARHPFGTGNSLVQFGERSFLELLTLLDANAVPPTRPGFFNFGAYNRDFLARQEGCSMLVLESSDAKAEARAWRAAGLGDFEPLHFERLAKLPDGSLAKVGFTLAFAAHRDLPDAVFFACQQHWPENFWKAEYQRHDNGAMGIEEAAMVAADPLALAGLLESVTGRPAERADGGLKCKTGRGVLRALTPAAFSRRYAGAAGPSIARGPRFAGCRIRMGDLAALRARLGAAKVGFAEADGAVVVPPAEAFGFALGFVQRSKR